MEKNQVVSVAVGVGAVTTLLGYLGYSYLQNRHPSSDSVEEVVGDKVEKKVEKEVEKPSFWESFWSAEYQDIIKSENAEEEEESENVEEESENVE